MRASESYRGKATTPLPRSQYFIMSSTPHTVTRNQLLQFILGKQGLLERHGGLPDVSIYPLHATNHTTPYLSLLARYTNFSEEGWKQFAVGGKDYFLSRCMRGTLHFVPQTLKSTLASLYQCSGATEDAEVLYNIMLNHSRNTLLL